jgi:hypothetical protein
MFCNSSFLPNKGVSFLQIEFGWVQGNCCWSLPAQSFLVLGPVGLITIYLSLTTQVVMQLSSKCTCCVIHRGWKHVSGWLWMVSSDICRRKNSYIMTWETRHYAIEGRDNFGGQYMQGNTPAILKQLWGIVWYGQDWAGKDPVACKCYSGFHVW